jgi:hypothetical protein
MPAWSKVLGDRPIRGDKPLGMPWGFEPLHPPLPLAGGLVRVLGTVVEVPMLAVLHSRQDLSLCSPIALQFIRNDHPGDILTAFEKLEEKLLRGLLIPAALHQNAIAPSALYRRTSPAKSLANRSHFPSLSLKSAWLHSGPKARPRRLTKPNPSGEGGG